MELPFGKYRGERISEVPIDYLRWCLRKCEILDDYPGLRGAISDEVTRRVNCGQDKQERHERREKREREEQNERTEPALNGQVKLQVKSWYREMARKYHPDRTLDDGSSMKVVNDCYERLLELLGLQR